MPGNRRISKTNNKEKILNKTSKCEENEYKHRNQPNNLNNTIQEKNEKYKTPVEGKQLQAKKTCYACGSHERLIKSCKKKKIAFTNEEWPEILEEEFVRKI